MHARAITLFFGLILAESITGACARAEVHLPSLISDHAILQQSTRTTLWGTANPGEKVAATIGGTSGQTMASPEGSWRMELDLSKVGTGPFDLVIEGSNKITISDVLVGEVWVASGQSNMEFPVKYGDNAGKEIAASADPQFRSFHVNNKTSSAPLSTVEGSWVVASPATTGNFTAVGYHFCKKLERELSVPVGLINSTWGGTPVEAWTSIAALDSIPALAQRAKENRQEIEGFSTRSQAYVQALQAWATRYNRTLPAPKNPEVYTAVDLPTTDWKPVHLPGTLAAAGVPNAGAVWLRRVVTLPPEFVHGHPAVLLGTIPGFDTVYWNGVEIGETTPKTGGMTVGRRYIPSINFQEGPGVLAIRIAAPAGGAAVPPPLKWGSLTLEGDWLAKVEKPLPPLAEEAKNTYPAPLVKPPSPQSIASYLYNGMIAPLTMYSIRGAIWYQGESNADRAFQYRIAFPLMIQDWRGHWAQGDFPFYFCQLANYMPRKATPSESTWAEVRESQAKTLSLPNTGMAVLIDCGDEANIHPHDKKTPGERLAAIALADTYRKRVPSAGPSYSSMAVEGNSIRIRFDHTDGGLLAKPLLALYAPTSEKPDVKVPLVRNVPESQLEGFAVCGEDHIWKWAVAQIEGNTVVMHADSVTRPVAVHYAWSDDPICNLYNGAGFPCAPFRTDDFPAITRNNKF